MSRDPRVTSKQIIKVVKRLGFVLSRQSGSHEIYKNSENKRVTIPIHGAKILHPKIVISIIRDAGITKDELKELL
ncbi:MAG: type II toxin-antitoxin system HicA family toxin [bacterium]|nr:type II toxin-antitoxin system HicA family toxin [bacterium]